MITNSVLRGLIATRKQAIQIFLLSLVFIVTARNTLGQSIPEKSSRLVNDYTQTLSQQQAYTLEQKLVAFADSTSTQIAVVIIQSLDGSDIASYAQQLGQKWGIGSKKNNNGVLLLVAVGDRKVTIQTGYGVEGALPDAMARRIIEREIKPNFKAGNYYQGIERGTDAIIAAVKGEYKADKPKKEKSNRGLFFIILIVLIIVIISRINKGGGNSQVIGGSGGASPFWWILLGSMLNNGGRGSNSGWGGGSDGGGFGGFGGGSFGGGGASGDW